MSIPASELETHQTSTVPGGPGDNVQAVEGRSPTQLALARFRKDKLSMVVLRHRRRLPRSIAIAAPFLVHFGVLDPFSLQQQLEAARHRGRRHPARPAQRHQRRPLARHRAGHRSRRAVAADPRDHLLAEHRAVGDRHRGHDRRRARHHLRLRRRLRRRVGRPAHRPDAVLPADADAAGAVHHLRGDADPDRRPGGRPRQRHCTSCWCSASSAGRRSPASSGARCCRSASASSSTRPG